MPTRRLKRQDTEFLKALGQKVEKIILKEMGYSSLDAFWLEFHDEISKATLYQLCEGKRDMKISTLLGLCRATGIPIHDLLKLK